MADEKTDSTFEPRLFDGITIMCGKENWTRFIDRLITLMPRAIGDIEGVTFQAIDSSPE